MSTDSQRLARVALLRIMDRQGAWAVLNMLRADGCLVLGETLFLSPYWADRLGMKVIPLS